MERQHIALTEAQIIAAEKGEIQLETRDGRKVVQLAWFRLPYDQNCSDVITAVVVGIEGFAMTHSYYKTGIYKTNRLDCLDLFVSEQAVDFLEPAEQSPKPLYEVGEIIEVNINGTWEEVEHIHNRNNNVVVWMNGQYHCFVGNLHRKKQTEKTVTLENKVMTVKEAFKYLTNIQ